MSITITLTCLFALLHFLCAIENKNESNAPTESVDRNSNDAHEILTNSLTTGRLKDTQTNDADHYDRNIEMKTIVYINGEERDEPAEFYPTSTSPFLKTASTARPAGLGTDVIFRLQEKLRNLANPANDKYIHIPEAWPVITLKIPRLTLPPYITPSHRTTRTFIDHFKTIKFTFRQLWNTNTNSRKPRSKDRNTAFTTRDMLFKGFVWTHNVTSSASWYDIGRFARFPNTPNLNGIKVTEIWENNPLMQFYDLRWMPRANAVTRTMNIETTSESYFLRSPVRENGFMLMEKTIPILRDNITTTRPITTTSLPTTTKTNTTNRPTTNKTNTTSRTTTTKTNTTNRPTTNKTNTTSRPTTIKTNTTSRPTTTTSITTTTTTNARTTRTYPYPDWVCYECGKNETKYGSSLCYDVFEANGKARNYTRQNLRYKCNGHRSVVYQCFKRFLDIGDYNERGCRDWPPRKSGRTFASKRLRALEKVLRGVTEGCVFSPNAALVPFSHTVQLYARFHVCVCEGKLCNTAGPYGTSSVVIFIMILVLKV